jgi:DUF4097 and DUF4098 domain-containing protein YvlB
MKTMFRKAGHCAALAPLVYCCVLTLNTATAKQQFTEEFRQVYPLSEHGIVRLDNVNGAIMIKAWDRNEVSLSAKKKADTQADLERLKIEVDSKSNAITIKTKYPESRWRGQRGTVDYELTVPRNAVLSRIKSVNGSVTVEGVLGKVQLSTVNGSATAMGLSSDADLESVNGTVRALFDSLRDVRAVRLTTVNGGAEIEVPKGGDVVFSQDGEWRYQNEFRNATAQEIPGRQRA